MSQHWTRLECKSKACWTFWAHCLFAVIGLFVSPQQHLIEVKTNACFWWAAQISHLERPHFSHSVVQCFVCTQIQRPDLFIMLMSYFIAWIPKDCVEFFFISENKSVSDQNSFSKLTVPWTWNAYWKLGVLSLCSVTGSFRKIRVLRCCCNNSGGSFHDVKPKPSCELLHVFVHFHIGIGQIYQRRHRKNQPSFSPRCHASKYRFQMRISSVFHRINLHEVTLLWGCYEMFKSLCSAPSLISLLCEIFPYKSIPACF